jgi:hypothetical protein
MTRGEEDYQDKVDPVVHVVKYAFDLFAISWCGKLRIAIKKKKKDGLLMWERRTNTLRQLLTIGRAVGAYVKDNIHGC